MAPRHTLLGTQLHYIGSNSNSPVQSRETFQQKFRDDICIAQDTYGRSTMITAVVQAKSLPKPIITAVSAIWLRFRTKLIERKLKFPFDELGTGFGHATSSFLSTDSSRPIGPSH